MKESVEERGRVEREKNWQEQRLALSGMARTEERQYRAGIEGKNVHRLGNTSSSRQERRNK